MSNTVNTGDNMISNNTRNNALLFLKVAPNTAVGDDGVLSIAFNFNDKEQVEHYRKAATSILNWIDMNEQALLKGQPFENDVRALVGLGPKKEHT